MHQLEASPTCVPHTHQSEQHSKSRVASIAPVPSDIDRDSVPTSTRCALTGIDFVPKASRPSSIYTESPTYDA
jgi:hypothetical protein